MMHQTAALPAAKSRLMSVVVVVAGSLVLAASARIATPFMSVPTTMQTYALVVLAACFGPTLATAMTVTYLVEGLAGLPVFAGGAAGPLVFLGPTAGYLVAFPLAAAMVGRWHTRVAAWLGVVGSFAVMMLAHLLIIAGGVVWLAQSLGLSAALAVGAAPFVLGTLVKSVLAAVTVRLVRR